MPKSKNENVSGNANEQEWEEVSLISTDIKKHEGVPFEGQYTGKKNIPSQFSENGQMLYSFVEENGKAFSIYGFTNLNRAMENVQIGQVIRITYTGTELIKTKYGEKDVHQVIVQTKKRANSTPVSSDTNVPKTDDLPF